MGQESKNRDCPDEIGTVGNYVITCCLFFIDANAMLLPGRIPGYESSDVKLLPSHTTKHAVGNCTYSLQQVAYSYSMFTQLWRQLLPHILVMKPKIVTSVDMSKK